MRLFLILYIFFSICSVGSAQMLVKPISTAHQVTHSKTIVEAEVIEKKSYQNPSNNDIYTLHELKVYSIFKGEVAFQKNIQLLTRGGSVGMEIQKIHPNLELKKGDIGVFMLSKITNNSLDWIESDSKEFYKAYSGLQGFYLYDTFKYRVSHPFHSYETITKLQTYLKSLTGKHQTLKPISRPVVELRTNATLNEITDFSPIVLSAGVKDTLLISGSGFGEIIGDVLLPDADSGGSSHRSVESTNILNWSDSEIQITVPSKAGTGKIEIHTFGNTIIESETDLTILKAESNATFDEIDGEYRVKLINQDGKGGYTWHYLDNFLTNLSAVAAFQRAIATWTCATDMSWLVSNQQVSDITQASKDGYNTVSFESPFSINTPLSSPETLGVTISYYSTCGRSEDEIIVILEEVDMVYNNLINWYYLDNEIIPDNTYDFEGTVTHELGHALNLGHVIETGHLMNYQTDIGTESATRYIDQNTLDAAKIMRDYSKEIGYCGNTSIVDKDCILDDNEINTDELISENQNDIQSQSDNNSNALAYYNSTTGNFEVNNILSTLEMGYVYDLYGQLITTSESFSFEASALTSGIYFILLELEDHNDISLKVFKN